MGNIVIKISNKGELEATIKHFEEKGWKAKNNLCLDFHADLPYITFNDGFHLILGKFISDKWDIIDFATFSLLTGVTVTKEIIVELKGEGTAKVTAGFVYFSQVTRGLYESQIEEICTALQSLKQ